MAEGKFVISAQNKIKDGLDAAKKDLLGFEDAAKKVGDTLKNAFAVTAIAAGLKKLGEAAFDCFKEFGEGDRRIKLLGIALNNNEASLIRATNLIDKLALQTIASKDDIENLVGELAALGKSDAEIEKIARAAVNLSNVTGKDLNSSFTLINATYAGTVGRLNQLLPEIGDLTTEQLEAGEATKLINEKFSTLSETLSQNNIPQQIHNLQEAWGDFKENIGQSLAPIFTPFLEGINQIITGWNNAVKAAQIHKQLLENASFEVKISLNEQLLSMNESRLKELSKMMAPLEKSMGGNTAYLRTNQQYMAWQAERTEIENENKQIQASIAELRAQLKANPSLATGGRVPTVGGVSGTDQASNFYNYTASRWDTDSADSIKVDWSGATQLQNALRAWDSEGADAISAFVNFDTSAQRYYKNLIDTFDERVAAWDAEGADNIKVDWGGEILRKAIQGKLDAFWDRQAEIIDQDSADSIKVDWGGDILKKAIQKKIDAFWAVQETIIDKDAADSIKVNYRTADKETFENATRAWDSEGADALSEFVTFDNAVQRYYAAVEENFERAVKLFDETSSDTVKVNWLTAGKETFDNAVRAWDAEGADALSAFVTFDKSVQNYFAAMEKNFDEAVKVFDANEGDAVEVNFLTAEKERFENAVRAWDEESADALSAFVEFDDAVQRYWAIIEQNFNRAAYIIDRESADALSSQVDWTGTTQQQNVWATADAEGADSLSQFVNWPELSTAQDAVIDGLIGLGDAFDSASIGMGDFGTALLGPISELMSALGPIANMIMGMNPLLAILIPVIEGFVSVIAPATSAVLKPLFDTLANIGVVLGQALLPIFDALAPIINMLAIILQATLIPVIQLLAPFIQIIALMIQPLGPAMGALAKAVIILMSPIEWLADLFVWVGEVLKTFAWNIAHPLRQQSGPGAFTSDAFSGLGAKLGAIDALMVNSQSLQNGTNPVFDASAATASQSASYRTQQITINIYQQAPVVGSGGMAEFVQMIRGQFAELAYYGA